MEKLAISFWTVFMHEICPEVIVESKINNRELVKAVKGLTDTEYRFCSFKGKYSGSQYRENLNELGLRCQYDHYFKNKKDIPDDMHYVELKDVYFNQNTVSVLDDRAGAIVEKIDASRLIGKYKIESKFNGVTLDIDCLSTGCKTVLNVLYFPEKVFCLKECGDNALEVLYSLEAGTVYSDYAIIPFDMDKVKVSDKNGTRIISDYEELKEWWSDED